MTITEAVVILAVVAQLPELARVIAADRKDKRRTESRGTGR